MVDDACNNMHCSARHPRDPTARAPRKAGLSALRPSAVTASRGSAPLVHAHALRSTMLKRPCSTSIMHTQPWGSSCSSRPAVWGSCSRWQCRRPTRLARHRLVVIAAAGSRQPGEEPTADAGGRRAQRPQQQANTRARSSTPGQQAPSRSSRSSSSGAGVSSAGSSSSSRAARDDRGSTSAADRRGSSSDDDRSSSRRRSKSNLTPGGGKQAAGGTHSSSPLSTSARQQPRRPSHAQQAGQQGSRPQTTGGSRKMTSAQVTRLIPQQTRLGDLLDLLRRHSSPGDVYHANASLQWLANNPREQPRTPEQLAALVEQLVEGVNIKALPARNCASIAYYCSKLGYVKDMNLYRDLLQRFMVVKGEAEPQHISNLLYALGSQKQLQGVLDQNVLVQLLQQLESVGDSAKPQELSNALWAAAKWEPGDMQRLGEVVAQLLGQLLGKLGGAKPQEVSNTLYALALLPRAWPMDSALQLVERLVQLLPEAQPQAITNVLWALGRFVEHCWLVPLSEQPSTRLHAALNGLMSTLAASSQGLKPQAVSNSMWGVAVLQAQVDWGAVGQLLGRVTQQQPNTQALANACWAVAKLQQVQDALSGQQQPWQAPFSDAVQAFVPLLPQAKPQHVANMLWACATVRHYPEQLLDGLTTAPAALPQVKEAISQQVANMALALAVLAPDPPPATLLVSLLQRMQRLLAQQALAVNSQELANTAWAVAVLDQQQVARQLKPLAAVAFSQQQWNSSQPKELCQWHQVHLWLRDTQVLGPAGLRAFPIVTQQQLEQCQAAWDKQMADDAKASKVQEGVAKVLYSMSGVEVLATEQRDQHDGSRSIDIVARYKRQLLAVEVDGPQHFTWPGQRPTGLTLARNRALERRGYRVVCVPVEPHWRQQRGQQQQQKYLQGLLDAAVAQPAASMSVSPVASTSSTTMTDTSSSSKLVMGDGMPVQTAPGVRGGPALLARPKRQLQPPAAPGGSRNKRRQ